MKRAKVKTKKIVEPDFTLTPRLQEAFVRFLEYHPAKRFSVNLRSWLLEFLMYDGSAEAEYLYHLVIDLDGLFELLEWCRRSGKGRRLRNERVHRLLKMLRLHRNANFVHMKWLHRKT